jgi:hypothetical protein
MPLEDLFIFPRLEGHRDRKEIELRGKSWPKTVEDKREKSINGQTFPVINAVTEKIERNVAESGQSTFFSRRTLRKELLDIRKRFHVPMNTITHVPEDIKAFAQTGVTYEAGNASEIQRYLNGTGLQHNSSSKI